MKTISFPNGLLGLGVSLICLASVTVGEDRTNTTVSPPAPSSARLTPSDITYLGAFRLPDVEQDSSWEYSGNAMTYCPSGDPRGSADGHPGSLFAVGHDHQQMISELAIPRPVISKAKALDELPVAQTLQPFRDVRGDFYGELEIPRAGLAYLPAQPPQRAGKLHFAWGQHFEFERRPTHGWCELDLSKPHAAGPWYLAHYSAYVSNDYLFEIPESWAAANTPGLRLATGRFRDGTWGGLGPALLAYGPWNEGDPPKRGATLTRVTPLLMYGTPVDDVPELEVRSEHKLHGFSEADEWSGGAWLTASNRSAVVLVGTKGLGKTWYGFANGVVYPTSGDENETYPDVPPAPFDQRGWWSERIEAQMIFYDPADLADVAHKKRQPWEPQPYATLRLDPYLFDPGFNHERQKRYLLGDVAFDRERGLLYLVERRADGEKSLIHVFSVTP